MWAVVTGIPGSGKNLVVDMLRKGQGFTRLEDPPLSHTRKPESSDRFEKELSYVMSRFRTQMTAQELIDRKDIVTVHSLWDSVFVFAKAAFVGQTLSERDFKTINSVYADLESLLKPPTVAIHVRTGMIDAVNRTALREKEALPSEELECLNRLYEEEFLPRVRVPLIEIDTKEQSIEDIRKSLEFSLDSIKSSGVGSASIWTSSFFR